MEARDDVAEVGLVVELELLPSGLLRIRATVTNLSATEPYTVDSLMPLLPCPLGPARSSTSPGATCANARRSATSSPWVRMCAKVAVAVPGLTPR